MSEFCEKRVINIIFTADFSKINTLGYNYNLLQKVSPNASKQVYRIVCKLVICLSFFFSGQQYFLLSRVTTNGL